MNYVTICTLQMFHFFFLFSFVPWPLERRRSSIQSLYGNLCFRAAHSQKPSVMETIENYDEQQAKKKAAHCVTEGIKVQNMMMMKKKHTCHTHPQRVREGDKYACVCAHQNENRKLSKKESGYFHPSFLHWSNFYIQPMNLPFLLCNE